MPTRTLQRTVNDSGPDRPDLRSGQCFAPATPTGKGRTTAQEDRIKAAFEKGADLDRLVSNYHVRPEVLMRILELDPADHPETYAQLLKTYDDLRGRALR